ncbi:hypothetical protein [Alicyclobacillus sp. ALC3]|uniref:hypothetical protein n=1 Tax=Alicyclobacillus sp. ALC3 TaxID=2796143 RepID=UPI0023781070|nr:hypothetical protein [Alicyclobacillus sp. ALC3]
MEVVREIEKYVRWGVWKTGDHCVVRLEDIKKDEIIEGILPHDSVRIVSAEPIGQDAVNVVFRTPTGVLQEQTLFQGHEPSLSLVEAGLPWSFDAGGDDFKLAVRLTAV